MNRGDAREHLRRFGPGWTLYRLGFDALNRLLRFQLVDAIRLEPGDVDASAFDADPPFACRFLSPDEIRVFAKDPENRMPREWVEEMLAKGDECFGILDGGALASFGWYSHEPTRVLADLEVGFDPRWVYMFHAYTKPAYRGRRLHALGMARALAAWTGRGYSGLVGFVERENRASVSSAERVGYRRFGSVLRLLSAGRTALWNTRGCRACGIRVRRLPRRSRPAPAPAELARVLAEERRIMDLYAPHYREHVLTNAYAYREERRRFVDWALARLREAGLDPLRLAYLDVGCSTGELAELLAGAGCTRLTGLDLSPGLLAEARRCGPPGAAWVRGVIEQHPFAARRFDVVISSFTLHHLRDVRPFFEMADTLLGDPGWFFLLDFDADAWMFRRRPRRRLDALAAPLRRALRRKSPNAEVLGRVAGLPYLFNPAHRVRGFAELQRAVPAPARWRLRRESHDRLAGPFHKSLVGESALDRALLRSLRRVDRLAAFTPGAFQWVAGERRGMGGETSDRDGHAICV